MLPSEKVTAESAAIMRALDQAGLHYHDIAALLCVNPGRVSEVIDGERFPDVPPARLDNPHTAALLWRAVVRLNVRLCRLLDTALDPTFLRAKGMVPRRALNLRPTAEGEGQR